MFNLKHTSNGLRVWPSIFDLSNMQANETMSSKITWWSFLAIWLLWKILNNFRSLPINFLVRENYLEFCQISHIPRTDHHNHYFWAHNAICLHVWGVKNRRSHPYVLSARFNVDCDTLMTNFLKTRNLIGPT